jgi:hypothetical protein
MKLPTVITVGWLTAAGAWALMLQTNVISCSWDSYAHMRFLLTIPFTLSAFACLWGFSSADIFRDQRTATLGDWSCAGVIFWVLFPPIWFFTEYLAVRSNAFLGGTAHLPELKDYADFASKIWAAFLALYLFTVTQRIKAREEELNPKKPY